MLDLRILDNTITISRIDQERKKLQMIRSMLRGGLVDDLMEILNDEIMELNEQRRNLVDELRILESNSENSNQG